MDNKRVAVLSLSKGMEADALQARGDIIVAYTKGQDEIDFIDLVQQLEAMGFRVTKRVR